MNTQPITTDPITTDPKTFAGIDVGKSRLDVALVCDTGKRFYNTKKGHHSILTWLREHAVTQVVCEPSGGYESPLVACLQSSEIVVSLAHPNRVRAFAIVRGIHAKTDRLDAQVLAQYGQQMEPSPTLPLSPQIKQLRENVDRRQQLIGERAREKNRLEKKPSRDTMASFCRHITFLSKEIARFEVCIEKIITDDPELARLRDLLCSVKGVGNTTAAVLLAHLPELGHCEGKPLSALAGVAPWAHDSGRKQGPRRIRGGRAAVRGALYMVALSTIRYDPELQYFYQRLLQRGKPTKVALVAVMHKRLLLLNAIAQRGTPWVENHAPKKH